MSQQLFNVGVGLQDDNNVAYLSGTGAPGGDASYQDAAGIGSYYRDIATANLYHKISTTASPETANWILIDPSAITNLALFVGQDNTNETFPSYGSPAPTHITEGSGQNLVEGLIDLDQAIGDNTWTQNERSESPTVFELDPGASVHYNLEVIDDVIGSDADFGSPISALNFIDPNVSIYANLAALDDAIGNGSGIVQTQVDNVTTITNIDTIPLANAVGAKWLVTAINTGDDENRESAEIYATNNGVDDVDYNIYSLLKLGSNINGLVFSVVVSGTDMILRTVSTTAVDVKAARIQVVPS